MKMRLYLRYILLWLALITGSTAPAQQHADTAHYYNALHSIEDMLEGKTPLSYARAVFDMENAWYGNALDYDMFTHTLDRMAGDARQIARRYHDGKTRTAALPGLGPARPAEAYEKALHNYGIHTLLTDTSFLLRRYDSVNNVLTFGVHTPYTYAMADPFGTADWKTTQVVNLLQTKTGNCFALASLFKILADRLDSDARLCTAPGHIYIRHADDKGILYNVDLATASFPGTGSIKTLTYTTGEAIRSGIALRQLNDKEAVTLCLVYLAKGFEQKFGTKNHPFILQAAELALKHDPLNLQAMLLKAGYLENQLLSKGKTVAALKTNAEFIEYENLLAQLYRLGYREMPPDMKNRIVSAMQQDSVYFKTTNHTPQVYKKLKVQDARYATLSWGMFEEVQAYKPIEQYGNTLFDTKTKKVTGFEKKNTLYNNYAFDPALFALSVDPLSHSFPELTPYQFASNTPIVAVDVEGLQASNWGYVPYTGGYDINPAANQEAVAKDFWQDFKAAVKKDATEKGKILLQIAEIVLLFEGVGLLELSVTRAAASSTIASTATKADDAIKAVTGKKISPEPVNVAPAPVTKIEKVTTEKVADKAAATQTNKMGTVVNKTSLTKSQKDAINGLEKQVAEHEKKLADYKMDPDAHDNLGHLKKASSPELREQIISRRIENLQGQINTFKKDIEAIKNGTKKVLEKK